MTLTGSVAGAIRSLFSRDPEVYAIAFTSMRFALTSTVIASAVGIPAGTLIGLGRFPGRRVLRAVLSSMMAVPTVVIGLFVYSLISRSGPFGSLGILFTPAAIIVGQALLAAPIITSLVAEVLSGTDPQLMETLVTLGAGRSRRFFNVLRESRTAALAAVVAGFGRVIGEVGVSMMLGGNIRWYTRTLTTAIALETSKGQFELGLALGVILLLAALVINAALRWMVRNE